MLKDRTSSDQALIERIHSLRSMLPAMAAETARARRESLRLRRENAALQERLETLESADSVRPAGVVMPLTPGDEAWR